MSLSVLNHCNTASKPVPSDASSDAQMSSVLLCVWQKRGAAAKNAEGAEPAGDVVLQQLSLPAHRQGAAASHELSLKPN